ncbi:hypothetical protein ANN_21340 [Periplaneta americana]|uniref:Uncharacterized protein n=1 Tax=Periplaneta americana TaxID=6978 RepID=A0ABQ8SF09_PERAM|nr:hypothetical protein ANN_21340 [Periplaneta americana]
MSKIFFSDEATFHVSSKQQVIGPFFFAEKTVCDTTYLDILVQFFFPQIEHLQPNILFQQDGAPPHWFNDVRTTLYNMFPGRWIGRGELIAWPPRSPDLTLLNFFLCGYVKDKVYATPVRDLRDLRERIIDAIKSIPEDLFQRAWQEIVHRLDIVTVTAGAHVEICADKYSIKHTAMRVLLFQTIAPGISLPPQPVLTRWKTWFDAVNYYAEYYGKIMELLEDILFIDSNFKIVSKSITLLESSKLQLSDALNIVDKVSQTVIQNNNSLISEKVK